MKYTKELLEQHVPHVFSNAELARRLGLAPTGSTTTNLGIRCRKHGIDTSHFTGSAHQKGRPARNKFRPEEVFTLTTWNGGRVSGRLLKRALLEVGVEEKCAAEGCTVGCLWNQQPLPLQVDHIDGDFSNNRRENLRLLCPNCHVQTKTWGHK